MLNVVEINLAIICASGPALRPLFRTWFPSLFGGTSANYLSNGKKPTGYGYGNSYYNGTGRQTTVTGGGGGIALKSMRGGPSQHTECRSISPSGSEEEIMTYNGILRTTDVQMNYEEGPEPRMDTKPSKDEMGIAH